MSKTVIEVKKGTSENNATLLRRFSRKMMDAGIIQTVKGKRYNERETSKLSLKVIALRRMNRRKEVEKLKKLGKMKEREPRGGARR
jgi:ribosomal protein S21